MIVHKQTMGALDGMWSGEYRTGPRGISEPLIRSVWLKDLPELDPTDWWEVHDKRLANKVRTHYPWIVPVVDEDGELADVIVLHEAQEGRSALREEAVRRGYRSTARVRPRGLMPFLVQQKPPVTQEVGESRKEQAL